MKDNEKSKEKIYVNFTVFEESSDIPFTYKTIKNLNLEDDDEIHFTFEDAYYSENNSYNAHYHAYITREVLETDEQYQKRLERLENEEKWGKERRKESYERLKKEFEKV